MPLNIQKLRVEFEKQIFDTNQFRGLAQGIAQRRANIAQKDMVEAFEENRVTKELEAGPDYAGPSVISYFNEAGNPNLYSFIGFPRGTDPLELLRKLLKFPIQVKLSTRVGATYYYKILAPSAEDIEEATPLPSEYVSGNFSWARGVEDADIPGIGEFLAIQTSASRSGGGIQVKVNSPSGSTLEATPYITAILEAFREKLEELSS